MPMEPLHVARCQDIVDMKACMPRTGGGMRPEGGRGAVCGGGAAAVAGR